MIGPSSFDTFLTESPGTILNIIPEPSSLLLALSGIGLAGAGYAARRRARHTQSR
jgi:hypothetical protein